MLASEAPVFAIESSGGTSFPEYGPRPPFGATSMLSICF